MDDSDAPTDAAMRGPSHLDCDSSVVSALTAPPLHDNEQDFAEVVLCGRDNQLEILQAAFERVKTGASEVVLVEGESGTGKSALVGSIRDTVIRNEAGFFVRGKFDQLQTMKEPFSAIAGALSDLCELILQSEQLPEWRERITSALGSESCRILSRVVSSLSTIVNGEHADEASYDQGMIDCQDFSRFKIVWREFLQAIARRGRPVVLFLDDLQWADEMSIILIKSLLEDMESRNVLLCIAYRRTEVDGEEILDLTLATGEHFPCTKITIGNLGSVDLSSVLSQLLHMDGHVECSLTKLILEKTDGNPNSVVQLLQLLKTRNLLVFSHETYGWEYNVNAIESEVSDNPSEIIAQKLNRLNRDVVETLKLAAYIGNSFNIDALRWVISYDKEQQQVAGTENDSADDAMHADDVHRSYLVDCLKTGVENGIIEKADRATYKFCHDSIQNFLYHSVEAVADRERTHLRIAKALIKWLDNSGERQEWLILLATSNVTQGAKHIVNEEERLATRKLCAEAAALFASKVSLPDTRKCLECAIKLEKEDDWVPNYKLCIEIQNAYAETLGSTGFFEESEQAVDAALLRAKTFKDKLRAQCAKLRSLISRRHYDEAVAWACDVVFKGMGWKFLKHPPAAAAVLEICRLKLATRKMRPEDYLKLPEVVDEQKLGTMMVMGILLPVVFARASQNPTLFLYIASRGLRLYLCFGSNAYFGPSVLAVILAATGKFDEAYEWTKVALTISERRDFNPISRSLTLTTAFVLVNPWREELSTSIPALLEIYELGMKNSADLAGSFFGLATYLDLRFHVGIPLKELEEETRRFCLLAREVQAHQMLPTMTTTWQVVLNLLGKSDDPLVLTGEVMEEDAHLRTVREDGDTSSAQMVLMYRLYLEISFEEWEAANDTTVLFLRNYSSMRLHYNYMLCSALVCLSSLTSYEKTRKTRFRRIARRHRQMIWKWAQSNTPTAQPLRSLVDAEWAAIVEGESDKAACAFEEAIEGFGSKQLVYFETLACERAMHLMLRRMHFSKAQGYLNKSIERNKEWGNKAKVEYLEKAYPSVLRSIRPAFEVKVTHT